MADGNIHLDSAALVHLIALIDLHQETVDGNSTGETRHPSEVEARARVDGLRANLSEALG